MDWDYRRRALWMYHNQSVMDQQLYAQQMQNAQLQAEIARLKAANTPVDPNYVDAEYKGNEDLMYSDEFVNAAYNPQAVPVATTTGSTGGGMTVFWVLFGILAVGLIIWLVFIKNWKTT